ncbi:conserved hypothetical protein [Acidithiobacillus caldus SM-1]|uniref:Uncharacterized protein n=1 Tax=Acidithiobacillus caldus (strain SM-1) TaxID=990288 RepID=F9ZRD7_ACICS|nr:conserved hypothetical protein [Acidithiobacillus caldus SM-1]
MRHLLEQWTPNARPALEIRFPTPA